VATDANQFGEDGPTAGPASLPSDVPSDVLPPTPIRARDRHAPLPDLAMLHRKARAAIDQELAEDEEIRLLIPGLGASAIVATDRRAFVFKTGTRAGLPFGARLKVFEYESVMRVDLRPGGEVDVVVIHAPLKISTCSSYWADPRDDPWRARNAIAVTLRSQTARQAAGELSRLASEFNARGAARRMEHVRPREGRTPDVVGRIAELEQRSSLPEIAPVRDVEREVNGKAAGSARTGSSAPVAAPPRARPRKQGGVGARPGAAVTPDLRG
jgi:hypothetical protein